MDTKLMKVADDFASFDLLKPKNQVFPRFWTQQTDSMFILSMQLKGYKQGDIKVEKTQDGGRITISGQKPVQDMLMIGREVVKKDIEMHTFKKSFKIPEGVVLNRVMARFNQDNSELIIQIPKAANGFMGTMISELKTEEIPSESTELLHVYANGELSEPEVKEENVQDRTKEERLEGKYGFSDEQQDNENPKQENFATGHTGSKEDVSQDANSSQRRLKLCTPVLLGSTLFMSLIVVVLHFVLSEKPKKSKKDKLD